MNGVKADPDIKMDPDAGTPGGGYMDEDFPEDTVDLAMPEQGVDKDLWLTRVPKWLYEKVSSWDDLADGNDDDQIEIGEVWYMPDENRRVSKEKPMRLFFNDKWGAKMQVPTAFEVNFVKKDNESVQKEILKSTYIFSEKDLPGYKPTGWGYGQGNRGNFGGVQDPKARIQKRTKFKKAIPKQTALLGCATREYILNPLDTREHTAFANKRTLWAIQGNHTKSNIVAQEHISEVDSDKKLAKSFHNFIKPAAPKKAQLNKAARIPKNELIDMLHKCFDRYQFWPMKALKKETQQPEAFLKEVLTEIASLVKSGPYASNYKRSGMYASLNEGKPPDDSGDEEEEMEDVV